VPSSSDGARTFRGLGGATRIDGSYVFGDGATWTLSKIEYASCSCSSVTLFPINS
jgi:hypothetical protein